MYYIKRTMLRLYIYLSGASFYLSELTSNTHKEHALIIKYLNGYEVKFYFHKEVVSYHRFLLGNSFNTRKCIYVVSAEYNEHIPANVQKYKNLRLYAKGMLFNLINDERILYEVLVGVYIDCLTKELQSH